MIIVAEGTLNQLSAESHRWPGHIGDETQWQIVVQIPAEVVERSSSSTTSRQM